MANFKLQYLALPALAALIAVMPAAAQLVPAAHQAWSRYTNERFHVSAEVPQVGFHALDPPANGDGQAWVSADEGVKISVSGSYWGTVDDDADAYRLTLRSYLVDDGANIVYEPFGAGWFVFSGFDSDGRIFYEKVMARTGCTIAAQLHIDYDKTLKPQMDAIVARMAKSLSPSSDC